MQVHVVCVGGQVFQRRQYAPGFVRSKFRVDEIWADAPPFIEFTVDASDGTILATKLLPCTGKLTFDPDGSISSIPWKVVIDWINISTVRNSAAFLQYLTVSVPKKELCAHRPKKRKQERHVFSELVAGKQTLFCSHVKHETYSTKSRTTLIKNIDVDSYENRGEIVCTQCISSLQKWAGDGLFHRSQATPLIKHAQQRTDAMYAEELTMLAAVFQLSRDDLMFYKYNTFLVPRELARRDLFKYGEPTMLFSNGINLQDILQKNEFRMFGCISSKEFRQVARAVANYKLYGKGYRDLKLELRAELAACMNRMGTALPATCEGLRADKFNLAVLSVFDKDAVRSIFCDSKWGATCFVHVFRSPAYALSVPGVTSIALVELSGHLKRYPKSTIVAWPAQFFSVSELYLLQDLNQSVILAGTPYVVGDHTTYGQGFTYLIERGHLCTSYGTESGIKRELLLLLSSNYTSPPPIPVTVLSTRKLTTLRCPTYTENSTVYFHRPIFTTLLYNFLKHGSIHAVSFEAGPLNQPTNVELVCCG